MDEIDGRLQSEYESILADALKEMRAQNDEQILATREEVEVFFKSKLDDLRDMVQKNDDAANYARNELKKAEKLHINLV